MRIERIRQKTIVAQVMEKFKELIATGHYKVHDKIPTESELAAMFGVGRSSIREAIKIFNYMGILESQIAKGTFVCDESHVSSEALTWSILLGKKDLDELIEIEGAIELWSLISLTERYRKNRDSVRSLVETLEDNIKEMQRVLKTADEDKIVKADDSFHTAIINASNNSLFISIYRTLRSFRYEEIKRAHAEDPSDCVEHHTEILNSVKTGDPQEVQSVFRKHLNNIKEKVHVELSKDEEKKRRPKVHRDWNAY
jgi:DNA-binding FadR family transcriptional regulator